MPSVLDAAQGKRADGAIKPTALEGQPFSAKNVLVYLNSRLLNPLLRQPVHSGVRINRRELLQRGGGLTLALGAGGASQLLEACGSSERKAPGGEAGAGGMRRFAALLDGFGALPGRSGCADAHA